MIRDIFISILWILVTRGVALVLLRVQIRSNLFRSTQAHSGLNFRLTLEFIPPRTANTTSFPGSSFSRPLLVVHHISSKVNGLQALDLFGFEIYLPVAAVTLTIAK